MDKDAQSEDPGKNGPGDPGLMAPEDLGAMTAQLGTSLHEALPPTIPAPMVPYGMLPMPGTSAFDAATNRRWVTAPIMCGSCHQHNVSFKIRGPKILKTEIGTTHVPRRQWREGAWTGPLELGLRTSTAR
jgi:hypothetical protein